MEKSLQAFFENRNELVLVFLYGSFADGRATEDSDVDIALLANQVLTTEQLLEFSDQLQRLLQREVDLVDISTAHGALLSEIICRGKLLLVRDHEVYAQLLKRMWYEVEDDGRAMQITLAERLRIWRP